MNFRVNICQLSPSDLKVSCRVYRLRPIVRKFRKSGTLESGLVTYIFKAISFLDVYNINFILHCAGLGSHNVSTNTFNTCGHSGGSSKPHCKNKLFYFIAVLLLASINVGTTLSALWRAVVSVGCWTWGQSIRLLEYINTRLWAAETECRRRREAPVACSTLMLALHRLAQVLEGNH